MKTKAIRLATVAVTAFIIVGLTSCAQFHNENDWAFKKGANHTFVPREVSAESER